MKNKYCTECNEIKSLNEFCFRKDTNAYRNKCKLCDNIRRRKHYNAHKEEARVSNKIWRNKNKEKVRKLNRNWRIKNQKQLLKYRKEMKKNEPWKLTWYRINHRCNNPKNPDYKYYGGKGIKNLLTQKDIKYLWIKDNASKLKQASIDRKNSNKNYTLENCRFIEQRDNIIKANKEEKIKPIIQLTKDNKVIKIWKSTTEAGSVLGLLGTGINNCLNNKGNTAYGFKWKYYKKEIKNEIS